MIAYVESNFVLELAFLQEQHSACDTLLEMAEAGTIVLVMPAYCIGEPYERITRRERSRKELHRQLTVEIHELSRSKPYAGIADTSKDVSSVLIESGEAERTRLELALERILKAAVVIPLDGDVLRNAVIAQKELALSPQDALVYASVVSHLSAQDGQKVFLNRNAKDFYVPEILELLEARSCKLIPSFVDGLAFVNSQTRIS